MLIPQNTAKCSTLFCCLYASAEGNSNGSETERRASNRRRVQQTRLQISPTFLSTGQWGREKKVNKVHLQWQISHKLFDAAVFRSPPSTTATANDVFLLHFKQLELELRNRHGKCHERPKNTCVKFSIMGQLLVLNIRYFVVNLLFVAILGSFLVQFCG